MKSKTVGMIVLCAATVFTFMSMQGVAAEKRTAKPKLTAKTVELRFTLRDLWIGHIFWVRNEVLMAKLGNTDAAKAAADKAVENAKAIANSVSPFYGQGASDKLFTLLAGHYGAIKEYMTATYEMKMDAQSEATDKMKKNADEIAAFLNGANPKSWPKETLASALLAHVGHHMAQINQFNSNDYAGEANTWEAMKKHMYVIADVLADGIVKQFPKKF